MGETVDLNTGDFRLNTTFHYGAWDVTAQMQLFALRGNLLEELHSEHVESGLATEFFNRRGVTSRSLEEGGAQEKDLAQRYRKDADRFADEWPRVAALLRSIGRSYEAEARRHEDAAERFRRGL